MRVLGFEEVLDGGSEGFGVFDEWRVTETVSNYIGETEKNMVRVFDGVQHRGSVLLFGELDLFGRRADSDGTRDRYIGD